MKDIWRCKIGENIGPNSLPSGADAPMRQAVKKAYKELTGLEPDFIFSGWGSELTDGERYVVDPINNPSPSPPPYSDLSLIEAEARGQQAERERVLALVREAIRRPPGESWATLIDAIRRGDQPKESK